LDSAKVQSKGKAWGRSWEWLRDDPSKGKVRARLWGPVREWH